MDEEVPTLSNDAQVLGEVDRGAEGRDRKILWKIREQ